MDRSFLSGTESRAHADALGAERERGDEPTAVRKPTGGQNRNFHLLGRRRNQDQAGDVVLARMTRALKAIDRDGIDAHALGRQGVTDRGALVDDFDAVSLKVFHVLLRLVPGGLHDLDAGVDYGL